MGKAQELIQGAFTFYIQVYHFVQKTVPMPISNSLSLNFCPNMSRDTFHENHLKQS